MIGLTTRGLCDYASMMFSGNVNATTIPDDYTITADNYFTNAKCL